MPVALSILLGGCVSHISNSEHILQNAAKFYPPKNVSSTAAKQAASKWPTSKQPASEIAYSLKGVRGSAQNDNQSICDGSV
jgi:hypothetical protein